MTVRGPRAVVQWGAGGPLGAIPMKSIALVCLVPLLADAAFAAGLNPIDHRHGMAGAIEGLS